MKLFRLIVDKPASATWNMAADEALMESQRAESVLPTLRFYFWKEPSITVGYFQKPKEISKKLGFSKRSVPVVKRLTGGGLVIHGNDLTFSLTAKSSEPFFSGEVKDSYLKIHEAVRLGLKNLEPLLDYADCRNIPSGRGQGNRACFENPVCHDLLVSKKKILGSSQRRISGAALHQGTIFLSARKEKIIEGIIEGFKHSWKASFRDIPWSPEEIEQIKNKEMARYSQEDWASRPITSSAEIFA